MTENEKMKLYLLLMEEIKVRFEVVNRAHYNADGFPPAMVREICYLQFRFLCEMIALGCLIAHGDIAETHALRDTYEPGKIIKDMERLNPDFYPEPAEVTSSGIIGRSNLPHLTKQELPKLWARSGDILHRTPMVKFMETAKPGPVDFSDIMEWSDKIRTLLNSHFITLSPEKRMIVSLVERGTNRAFAYTVNRSPDGTGQVSIYRIADPDDEKKPIP